MHYKININNKFIIRKINYLFIKKQKEKTVKF